jgi:hypothetical protein
VQPQLSLVLDNLRVIKMKYVFLLFGFFELFLMILMLFMLNDEAFEGSNSATIILPYSLTMLMAAVAAIGLWKRKLWGIVACALSIVICIILEIFFVGSGKIFLVHIGLLSFGISYRCYISLTNG